jgi:endonuclease-3 related protein
MDLRRSLESILTRLDAAYDFRTWHWQAHTPAEYVCISAVLVQHTNWANVERALGRLTSAGACSLEAIGTLTEQELAELVRPAGMPFVKARRLRNLAQLAHAQGGLGHLLELPTDELRARLLATEGVGLETADAIALNAAGRPIFQIDAYTIRIFRCLNLGPEGNGYERWRHWFEAALPPDAETYRRYHGLLVLHGKQTCRPRPRCGECCLLDLCPTGHSPPSTRKADAIEKRVRTASRR